MRHRHSNRIDSFLFDCRHGTVLMLWHLVCTGQRGYVKVTDKAWVTPIQYNSYAAFLSHGQITLEYSWPKMRIGDAH